MFITYFALDGEKKKKFNNFYAASTEIKTLE